MRGRQVFMESLALHDCDRIFGNPGTTENPLLESLLEYPDVEYIVALHEGVAVCSAGFYAQATGRTPLANVHVAPGLGNAIGMMYGCFKARVPVVITAGQQDTRMRLRDPLLRHDLVEMAKPVVKWAVEPQSADEIGPIMRRAFQIANQHPKGPVFVALPNNVMEQETDVQASAAGSLSAPLAPDESVLTAIATKLIAAAHPAICVGDDVAVDHAINEFLTLTKTLGAAVYTDFLLARKPIASDHSNYVRALATDAAQNRAMLADHDVIVLLGGVTMEEIWYETGSALPDDAYVYQIEADSSLLSKHRPVNEGISGDLKTLLKFLNQAILAQNNDATEERQADNNAKLKASQADKLASQTARFDQQQGLLPMAVSEAVSVLAGILPNNIVIVDESITASADVDRAFRGINPADFFAGRGGGIGQGIAGALGTAVAMPDRPIIALSGDGSAMYSIQALWTAAHHDLNILFVILANAEYRVLKHNLDIHRQRFDAPSDQPYPHMDLTNPLLGFAEIALGMGVQGSVAVTPEEVAAGAQQYLHQSGPYLLELKIEGKG